MNGRFLCACLALACVACARPTTEIGAACQFGTADFAITEVMISPDGDAPEWVEIYNASKRPQVLNRAILNFNADTGATQQWLLQEAREIPAEAYWVVGNRAAPYVNSVATNASSIAARNMEISLTCRDQIADRISIAQHRARWTAHSVGFEGFKSPDAALNDDDRDWCSAKSNYSERESGTPGKPNGPCGMRVCREPAGGIRNVEAPAARALVISEVYRDAPGDDRNREWVEFYNRGETAFDLNGLVVRTDYADGNAQIDIGDEHCMQVAPATFAVVRVRTQADAPIPDDNVTAYVVDGTALNNGDMAMTVLDGAQALAQATFGPSTTGASEGAGDLLRTLPEYCPSHREGLFGMASENAIRERGTPGGVNDPCGEVCRLADGRWRVMHPPLAGDLVISEWYSDPRGADAGYEWLEIYANTDSAIDLNGVEISSIDGASGNARSFTVDTPDCVEVMPRGRWIAAGERVEFAMQTQVFRTAKLQLYNAAGELRLIHNGLQIDRAVVGAPVSGRSAGIEGDNPSAALNDDNLHQCGGRSVGIFSDAQGPAYGTPGLVNDPCGAQWCQDGAVWRERQPFAAGGAMLSEVYVHSSADDGADWLEIEALADGDLNGLTVNEKSGANARVWTLEVPQCVHLRAGMRQVIAGKNADIAGALIVSGPDWYANQGEFSLWLNDVMVDSASIPAPPAGIAIVPVSVGDVARNDSVNLWCRAMSPTPGAENASCVP